MLGIIGAMTEEVAQLKDMMKEPSVFQKGGMCFYKGYINDKQTVVVKCGVGKVNAAMCTQMMIDNFDVDGIINTGIAGSLNADINIGDILIATDALEHDMDVAGLGYGPGIIPDMDMSIFKADERLKDMAISVAEKAFSSATGGELENEPQAHDIKTFTGRVVSGDQFISSKEKKKWLIDTFGGSCCEMEGAAIAHVASLNEVPFLIIRAISDKADDSAEMDYPTFAAKAIDNSIKLMTGIIDIY